MSCSTASALKSNRERLRRDAAASGDVAVDDDGHTAGLPIAAVAVPAELESPAPKPIVQTTAK